MKKITIEKMTLKNFRGIENLEVVFNPIMTFITGHNGVGKTSIENAWLWLLTGKDSDLRKDFDIKPKDENGNYKKTSATEVHSAIDVNGVKYSLKRIYTEKWTKKRNSNEMEFNGNETNFFINEVPYSQTDFNREMLNIISTEEIIHLLGNIKNFNSLDWIKQRQYLTAISPKVTVDDIFRAIEDSGEFTETQISILRKEIESGKTIDMFKKQMDAQIKLVKDSLEGIPVRIDEVQRQIVDTVNFAEIEANLNTKKEQLEVIEKRLNDANLVNQEMMQKNQSNIQAQMKSIQEAQTKKFEQEQKLKQLERSRTSILSGEVDVKETASKDAKEKLRLNNVNIVTAEHTVKSKSEELEKETKERNELISKWSEVKNSVCPLQSNPNDEICPTCKQPLPLEDRQKKLDEAIANWNNKKVSELVEIEKKGTEKKALIDKLTKEIADFSTELAGYKTKVAELESNILLAENELNHAKRVLMESQPTQDEITLKAEIDAIVIPTLIQPEPIVSANDVQDKSDKAILLAEIETLKTSLNQKTVNESNKKRITELLMEQKALNTELLTKEGIESIIKKYVKVEIQSIEDSVNSLFEKVNFKLFEFQVNGTEKEICKCMINGVHYPTLNTAGKVHAGMDVIKTLQNHYQIMMPIFADNKESVSQSEMVQMPNQLIYMQFVEGGKLTVN
jgi:DNA repair protein SbcC/Rad50